MKLHCTLVDLLSDVARGPLGGPSYRFYSDDDDDDDDVDDSVCITCLFYVQVLIGCAECL